MTLRADWHKDLHSKGFVVLREPELQNLIALPDDFIFINREERLRDNEAKDFPAEIVKRMDVAANYLRFKYLEPTWGPSVFKKFIIWDGVDKDNQYWHTDAFEDMDLFFLYYFDDTHEETGGCIRFKWGDMTEAYQPKSGDLILVSNKRGFFHRADQTTIRRRVASFDFELETDLP